MAISRGFFNDESKEKLERFNAGFVKERFLPVNLTKDFAKLWKLLHSQFPSVSSVRAERKKKRRRK